VRFVGYRGAVTVFRDHIITSFENISLQRNWPEKLPSLRTFVFTRERDKENSLVGKKGAQEVFDQNPKKR
jgi:hypothetical protein